MRIVIPLLVALQLALFGAGEAQGQKQLGADDVAALIDFGFAADEILGVLDREGTVLAIDAGGIERLRAKGAPEPVLARLRRALPQPATAPVTVDEIIALCRSKTPDADVLALVRAARPPLALDVDSVLALVRGGVPAPLIAAFRELRAEPAPVSDAEGDAPVPGTASARERITRDAVVEMAARKIAADEIVRRIEAADARFTLSTEDVLALRRDGVPIDVIRVMYARRLEPIETAGGDVAAATEPVRETRETELELFRPRSREFSMLAPASFIKSEEFAGRKALVQMVDASAAGERDLPDLELSVLVVRPKKDEDSALTSSNLLAVAASFVADLQRGFESDGIRFAAQEPERTFLSGREAAYVGTSATTPSGTGHKGGCWIAFAEGRIVVVTYSARLELQAEWRDVLEMAARSVSLEGEPLAPVSAETDGKTAARSLFGDYKRALERYDWRLFAAVHRSELDEVAQRAAFLASADELRRDRKRVEMGAFDELASRLAFDVFGLDGRETFALKLERDGDVWRLAPAPAPHAAAATDLLPVTAPAAR